jgi:hypothetical protein
VRNCLLTRDLGLAVDSLGRLTLSQADFQPVGETLHTLHYLPLGVCTLSEIDYCIIYQLLKEHWDSL